MLRTILVVVAGLAAAWLVSWLTINGVRRTTRLRSSATLSRLHTALRWPLAALLFITILLVSLPLTGLAGTIYGVTRHGLLVALIVSAAWFAVRLLFIAEELAFQRFPLDIADNRRTRRIRTQIGLLRRLGAAIIILAALGAAMTTFAALRTLGASLLASAGVAGIVLGLAAQSTLSHIFAGLQLAFSDTLRLDDVIVVEGEWGRVEELRLTHVVLYLWDQRRLLLPTSYFTSTPFQNWTRHESRVLGAMNLYLDYETPVKELREVTQRIVEASPLWAAASGRCRSST